jgi:EpsI family protein
MGVLAPLIGVPSHIEGTLVVMPNGIIEVAHGCSGQAFFTVGLAVAALLGELEGATLVRRAVLFLVLGALAVLSNWLRVLVIIDAGYTTNMRHVLVSRGHFVFGWVLFTVVLVTAVWFLARAARPGPQDPQPSSGPRSIGTGMETYAAAVAALIAMPLVVYIFVAARDEQAPPLAFRAPVGQGEWRGPLSPVGKGWQPEFVGDHSQWYFAYQNMSGHNVELVAIGYPLQEQGRELVNEENALLGATATSMTAEGRVKLDEGSYVESMGTDGQGRRWLVWYVYDIGGHEFVSPLMSQLWYGVRSLGGAPYSVEFAFRTACEPSSCDSARALLKSFARAMGPQCFASFGRAAPSPKLRPL